MRVLDDMGCCSDRCKLYDVVCPYGKWWDGVYMGCEKDGDGEEGGGCDTTSDDD